MQSLLLILHLDIVDCSYSKQVWWCIQSALRETHQLAHANSTLNWWNVWREQWTG
jgi:hypothetical protein